jgi:hypothetical protein
VLVVLEGRARAGVPEGRHGAGLTVVHATADGDTEILRHCGPGATVVTADRALRDRVGAAGAGVAGPGWLHGLLGLGPVLPEERVGRPAGRQPDLGDAGHRGAARPAGRPPGRDRRDRPGRAER